VIPLWFGYHVYATGGDRDASRLNGIKVVGIGINPTPSPACSRDRRNVFAARLASAPATAFDGPALERHRGGVSAGPA
jgi:ABC-type xylose transport system permease subunit